MCFLSPLRFVRFPPGKQRRVFLRVVHPPHRVANDQSIPSNHGGARPGAGREPKSEREPSRQLSTQEKKRVAAQTARIHKRKLAQLTECALTLSPVCSSAPLNPQSARFIAYYLVRKQKDGLDGPNLINDAALFFGLDYRTIKHVHETIDGIPSDELVATIDMAFGQRAKRQRVRLITDQVIDECRVFIASRRQQGLNCFLRDIRAFVFRTFGKKFCSKQLSKRLREHDLKYEKMKLVQIDFNGAAAINARRRYLIQYARAREEEAAGSAICVYTDESYSDLSTRHKYSWALPNNPGLPTRSSSQRCCMIFAITKDGVLHERPVGPEMPNVPLRIETEGTKLSEPLSTSEHVIRSSSKEDYHNAFSGEGYLLYVRNRICTTFDALYPGLFL